MMPVAVSIVNEFLAGKCGGQPLFARQFDFVFFVDLAEGKA
jgi:hypothetical protein